MHENSQLKGSLRPLAKLWTQFGSWFVLLAIGWAVFAANGLGGESPTEGARIARCYFGLVATLIAGSALVWIAALYIREAKTKNHTPLIPPNTTYEDPDRSLLISWGTALAFALTLLSSLYFFGGRFIHADIHTWNEQPPLPHGFWESRAAAYKLGCKMNPCYAFGPRELTGEKSSAIEYVLYFTDAAVVVPLFTLLTGLACLLRVILWKSPSRS